MLPRFFGIKARRICITKFKIIITIVPNYNFILISENIVSEGELALALGYLIGDTCLYRAACEEPHIAREYLGAAEMLLQTMKLMPQYVYKILKKNYKKLLIKYCVWYIKRSTRYFYAFQKHLYY